MLVNIRNPNKFPVLNVIVIISKYSRICEELPERKINFDYDRYSSLGFGIRTCTQTQTHTLYVRWL